MRLVPSTLVLRKTTAMQLSAQLDLQIPYAEVLMIFNPVRGY